jgi:hypothetical protein
MISPTPRRLLVSAAFAAIVVVGVGCRTAPPSHAEPAAAGSFAGSKPWLRTELFMGPLPIPEWQRFLSEVVTPRFPSGFTVLEAQGQWQAPSGEIRSLPSRVLVLLHPADTASETGIESIRTIFKERFGHISVLRSTSPATVGF